MQEHKRKALEKSGWRVGNAAEFLGLTDAESEYVEVKAAVAHAFSAKRHALKMSQATVAKKLESSQSRVAKMEAGNQTVSLDLLVRSLLKLGTTTKDLAKIRFRRQARRPGGNESRREKTGRARRALRPTG